MDKEGKSSKAIEIGAAIVIAVLGAAVTYGALTSRVDNYGNMVNKLEVKFDIEKTKREAWEARVLPLDADQSAQLNDIERRVERLEARVDRLEGISK